MRTETKSSPIVLGVDADTERPAALAWAADEARRRRRPLALVHAQGEPLPGSRQDPSLPSWQQWRDEPHAKGSAVLEDALAFVEKRCPGVAASALLAEGHPAWVLAEQSRHAALVVVGSRHLGAARELFSSAAVALPLSARSACPVVVLREDEHTTHQPPHLVVGVDGSPNSAAAVDFAFQEAELRGANLRALYVWHTPLLGALDEHAALQECRRVLAETTAGRTAARPSVELHHEVVEGHPVQELSRAAADALGLVVGTRGRGGFRGMLLGSVSQGVLHHAYCPVFLVPHRRHQ
ncbi:MULTISPECIES: universal stress protein [unclassified Streptomyces]|uniref:Universal stress protein n=1 Tax=Streptomyces salinarius TaxID=2762598 RepID=A0ABW8BEK7_9ACTN|nr:MULTISPECIES: universal stress protein [unclassified Streptomyces]NDZ75113.1 universal stress protein [Streptomyces sp. SID10362]QUW95384.1 Universal stress protein [Streptomyces sp. V17-9]